MSFDINPILSAVYAAVNGVATFAGELITSFVNALVPYAPVIAAISVLSILGLLFARVLGFDILGLVRSVTGRVTGAIAGAL